MSSVIGENGVFTPTWWETESFAKDFPDAQPGDQYTLKFDAGTFWGFVWWCRAGDMYTMCTRGRHARAHADNPFPSPTSPPHTHTPTHTAKIPGVNVDGAGFWSVTAYSLPDRKLVPNVLGRCAFVFLNV